MTGKVINLNKARKSRKRMERRQAADENAVKFGRTKGEKIRDEAEARRAASHLDGRKQED